MNSKQEREAVPNRADLLALAECFPALWSHPATDHLTKKHIVRIIVQEIIARLVDVHHILAQSPPLTAS